MILDSIWAAHVKLTYYQQRLPPLWNIEPVSTMCANAPIPLCHHLVQGLHVSFSRIFFLDCFDFVQDIFVFVFLMWSVRVKERQHPRAVSISSPPPPEQCQYPPPDNNCFLPTSDFCPCPLYDFRPRALYDFLSLVIFPICLDASRPAPVITGCTRCWFWGF